MDLSAWKDKRLADMDRADLIAALQDIWRMYCDVNRRSMTSSAVPQFQFTDEQADAKFRDIAEHGIPKMKV